MRELQMAWDTIWVLRHARECRSKSSQGPLIDSLDQSIAVLLRRRRCTGDRVQLNWGGAALDELRPQFRSMMLTVQSRLDGSGAGAPADERELDLDPFEGRSWTGLHRHAFMTMIAHAFLQSRWLEAAGRKKGISGPPPQPSMPAIRQAILDLFVQPPPLQCPHCEMFLTETAKSKVPTW